MPVYDRVLDDGSGTIWARHYSREFSEVRRWDLFTRAGRFEGTVETPARLSIAQVGPDWILGIYYDELMVPSVRMHLVEQGTAEP